MVSHVIPNYYNTLYCYYTLLYGMYFVYYSRSKEISICNYYLIRKPTLLIIKLYNIHYILSNEEYIIEREGEYCTYSTSLRKVLELGRWWKVRVRSKGSAQSPSMFNNHVNSDTLTFWSSREIFYMKTVILRSTVTMKLTWSSRSYLALQSEIQLFLDRKIPLQLSGEMPQILKF